ncbi:MAG TPA: TonB-dependent receptor [Steroidobacteraceae bacterium]|nr:TonB-dependent receptor [Gammaproteobacteria bacterium]HEV2284628.1 TonB-dependent receptor [Steroidobacteraceae bacterium]
MSATGWSRGSGRAAAGAALTAWLIAGAGAPAFAQEQPEKQAQGSAQATGEIETIIVSARKREESLAQVPTSITAFTPETLKDYNIQSFSDYATKTPDLSFTYGGGPTGIADSKTIAIRGITGQNLFGTAGATGFYIDDTPVPGSLDPRVVDISSIEVLKGPQGTLYGESSLGGNVRLITRQPDLNSSGYGYMLDGGVTSGGGSPDGGGNFIANVVLIPGSAALRVVLFGNHDAGYLTRTWPISPLTPGPSGNPPAIDPTEIVPRGSSNDQGAVSTGGGSLALLVKPSEALDIKLRVLYQDSKDHGFPATFAPLPNFDPVYTMDRAFDVQPYATDVWTLPSLDIKYAGSGWAFVWSNSYFYRHTYDVEDSTYGTEQILSSALYQLGGVAPQPYLWIGDRHHDQFSSEARLSWDPVGDVSGTVGVYYSNTHTRFTIPPTNSIGIDQPGSSACEFSPTPPPCTPASVGYASPAWTSPEIWTQTNPGTEEDKSVFGEVYWKFAPQWTLTLGGRQYWLNQTTDYTADGFLNGGPQPSDPQANSQSGFNPKVALAWQMTAATMAYASASKGFRAGGAQANFPGCTLPSLSVDAITHIRSDTLWTYEAGVKSQLPAVLISAAAYDIEWSNLQQQVALACGFYAQVNGNSARVRGAEFEASGRLGIPGLQFRLGLGYEDTDVTDPGNLALFGVAPGSRIAGVPDFNGSAGLVYTRALGASGMDGFVSGDYSYQGNAISLLVGGSGSQATRPGFGVANLRFGVDRGDTELSLNIHNLLNAKPNLGDIGYIGYAQFNTAGVIPQVATMLPLTVTLQLSKSF